MPRKSKRRGPDPCRLRAEKEYQVSNNGTDHSESRLKIGLENAERWFNLRWKFGFLNDIEFADYLLTLAENKRPDDGLCESGVKTLQESNLPLELTNTNNSDTTNALSSENLESNEFISIIMDCDNQN